MTKFTNFFRVFTCITCLLITSNVSAQVNWPPPSSNMLGNGTSGDPWQITTEYELEYLAIYVNAGNGSSTISVFYMLMNDLDYLNYTFKSVLAWSPIGNNVGNDAIFKGNFDGNNKVISNLPIHRVSQDFIGLFGYIFGANIHNLGVETCDITGREFVGALVGHAENSTIENCYATGGVTGTYPVGGLIGNIDNYTIIRKNYSTCTVSGKENVGGFIGANYGTTEESYSGGIVYGTVNQTGGFVGGNYKLIKNCYATGNVIGKGNAIGGFVGDNKEEGGSIIYCYAAGDVSGTGGLTDDNIGGFAGMNDIPLINCVAANNNVSGSTINLNRISGANTSVVSNCYAYDLMIIPPGFLGGVSGIPKDMPTLMSFNFYNTGTNWFNNNEWSIDVVSNPAKIWILCNDDMLPRLQWEGLVCDTIVDPCDQFQDGSVNFPFLICNAEQLAALATFVNSGNGNQTAGKYYKVMNDIDLIDYSTGSGWAPIGHYIAFQPVYRFQGNFDGNGKVIYNLKINRGTSYSLGLFGSILNASIHDLGLDNCDIYGGEHSGSLVGISEYSLINNCFVTGIITGTGIVTDAGLGGLVGNLIHSTVDNCFTSCQIIGQRNRNAGLVGSVDSDNVVKNSYATGNVTGTSLTTYIGGLVGFCYSGNNITNCYATGNVKKANMMIGGLIGSNGGTINYCYAKGTVVGTAGTYYVGGLVGLNSGGTIINCVAANDSVIVEGSYLYCINRIAGVTMYNYFLANNYAYDDMVVTTSYGEAGINAKMDTLISFNFYDSGSNWYNNIPWDIDDVPNPTVIWGICDGKTLPFFQWQGIDCGKKAPFYSGNNEKNSLSVQNVKPEFSVFPNPTSNHITISSERDFHSVEIIDLFGRIIYSQINQGNRITIDVSKQGAGMYFVRIITNEGAIVKKFVKR